MAGLRGLPWTGGAPVPLARDPPEGLFEALRKEGLALPRPAGGDAELVRAEAIPAGVRPAVAR
jgi:hypothetical protein